MAVAAQRIVHSIRQGDVEAGFRQGVARLGRIAVHNGFIAVLAAHVDGDVGGPQRDLAVVRDVVLFLVLRRVVRVQIAAGDNGAVDQLLVGVGLHDGVGVAVGVRLANGQIDIIVGGNPFTILVFPG